MIYYIDLTNGKKDNSGLDEKNPINYYKELDVKKGDTILFKRGTFVRDRLYNRNGVSYGAYGEGENPTFCGSVNLHNVSLWEETENNIWRCRQELPTAVCNMIYNNGAVCGALRYSREELSENGDFYDGAFGNDGSKQTVKGEFYIYSEGNPAEVYTDIECVVKAHRQLAEMGEYMSFSDISFINNGVHAIAGINKARNVHIQNCIFRFIGGSVWSKERKIRFGNAIECWDIAENIVVENCVFDDIYDSAITHQGDLECKAATGFVIKNNVFKKCGMAAYEQRDIMPLKAEFIGNECSEAGEGFSKLGEVMPRYSEIWPQPMGHHLFLWRIEHATPNGGIIIKNNKFGSAPYGEAIYSIISSEAEKQLCLSGNTYEEECRFKD